MNDSILNHPLVSERYFFPRPANLPDPFWVECGQVRLACYYHQKQADAKTIVHFHGNGEVVGDYLYDFVPTLDQLGYNVFLAEYRGYGMSGGQPELVTMLADAEQIIKATGLPPEQIILFGRSVGSMYALHAASRFPTIAGLILESGIANPLERLVIRIDPQELGVTHDQLRAAVAQDLNHRQKLAAYQGATLILHTRYDGLVDVSHAEQLHDWAATPKTLKIFEQGDHNSILYVNFREYFELVQTFIQSL